MNKMSLLLDSAAWFDILSIGEVKMLHLDDEIKRTKSIRAVEELYKGIEKYLGPLKLKQIYESREYAELYKTNEEVFHAVDLAERNAISAQEVAQLNNKRYICKRAIQEKFFEAELEEVKSGV